MTQESEIQSLFAETNEINSLNGRHSLRVKFSRMLTAFYLIIEIRPRLDFIVWSLLV
jgi:hypothetical protein